MSNEHRELYVGVETELERIGDIEITFEQPTLDDVRAYLSKRGLEIVSDFRDKIEAAHMAGQSDAGVDPGYSNARAYYKLIQSQEGTMNHCQCGLCETEPHDSDCAVHNEPATPNGDCDCKGGRISTEKAMSVIKQAMIDDDPGARGSYAHSWHCNIAMMCYDAIHAADIVDECCMNEIHEVSNDAASRFMKLCFDVETTNEPTS